METTKPRDRDPLLLWTLGALAAAVGGSYAMLHTEIGEVRSEMNAKFDKTQETLTQLKVDSAKMQDKEDATQETLTQLKVGGAKMQDKVDALQTSMVSVQNTLNQILANSSGKKPR